MLIGLLDKLKNLNKTVKFLRLDDAGENLALAVSNTILGYSLSLVGQEPLREMAK
jgi:hypothetical protein